jgi:hypothetical protein
MRLWSIHPKYLDAKGLVALWREGLLARAVLRGKTMGYKAHPQLARFRGAARPVAAVDAYLGGVWAEAAARGYSFDRRKIGAGGGAGKLPVNRGQVAYEWAHLLKKLARRDPARRKKWGGVEKPQTHPLFRVRSGDVEGWEKTS